MVRLNEDERIIEFVSFCIENFKVKYKMKGKDVANLFNKSGVIDFLMDSYDLLHTQGKEYILSEIQLFLMKEGYVHQFDIVKGCVADDRVYACLNAFENKFMDFETAIKELKTYKLNDQVSFHTNQALKYLKFLHCEEV